MFYFSKWFGMDYNSGIYTEKDFYLEDTLSIEQLHFKLEKLVTEGYKNNKLIFPNILNFEGVKGMENVTDKMNADCRLNYDKTKNRYILIMPDHIDK